MFRFRVGELCDSSVADRKCRYTTEDRYALDNVSSTQVLSRGKFTVMKHVAARTNMKTVKIRLPPREPTVLFPPTLARSFPL